MIDVKNINGIFTKETLTDLSSNKNEPDWIINSRIDAFNIFENLPLPSSRRLDYSNLDLSEYNFNISDNIQNKLNIEISQDKVSFYAREAAQKNYITQTSSGYTDCLLSDAVRKQGLILTDIYSSLKENPDIIKKYFQTKKNHQGGNKFVVLNEAFWNSGFYLYVPKNINVNIPLHSLFIIDSENLAAVPHNYLIVEEGSEITFIESYVSHEFNNNSLLSGITEIYLGANAKLNYISIQENGANVNHFAFKKAVLNRDSSINWIEIVLGGKLSKSKLESILKEPGSEVSMSGLFFGRNDQQIEFNTIQNHLVPHTKSDLLYIGALNDNAHSNYEGIIRVNKGAQKTDAYQSNRNLILSKDARADSEPYLEIEANDVRCTHGATVGPIDKEDLFYLMSRGLPKNLATKLLVQGFFSKVIEKIEIEKIRTGLQTYIEEHVKI